MKKLGMWFLCLILLMPVVPYFSGQEAQAAVSAKKTGWQESSTGKHYFYRKGKKVKGWNRISNEFRYFTKGSGIMVINRKVDGRKINKEGVWKPVIVLDPGHSANVASGYEPLGPGSAVYKAADNSGTQGIATGVEEYQLTLIIAKALKQELERRGCKVYLTRTNNNTAISCKKRAEFANKKKADAYIRIHANGSDVSSAQNGAMTICTTANSPYVSNKLSSKSKTLSTEVLSAYVKATKCRKEYVWQTNSMTGNNWSKVPTTIVEMGYMSNPTEDRNMQQKSYQKKMVQGIANGIEAFLVK